MVFIFIITFILIFFLGWLLYNLSGKNVSKMYHWTLCTYAIMLSISCSMWIYESIHTGDWFDLKINNSAFLFLLNLIFFAIVSVCWVFLYWFKNKKSRKPLMYGMIRYDDQLDFRKENAEGRFIVLLVMSLIVLPGFNISFIIEFINRFFM